MKRSEFDELTTLNELIEFGQEAELGCVEDIYYEDAMNEDVYDDIRSWEYSWQELGSCLVNLPEGYEWYRRNGCLDFEGLSDRYDFDDLRNAIIDEMEGYWDAEDEEDESDNDYVRDDYRAYQRIGHTNEKDQDEECEAPEFEVFVEFVSASCDTSNLSAEVELKPW